MSDDYTMEHTFTEKDLAPRHSPMFSEVMDRQTEIKRIRACVEVALGIAEHLLMEAEGYDAATRLVPADDILRIVQELNSALLIDGSTGGEG